MPALESPVAASEPDESPFQEVAEGPARTEEPDQPTASAARLFGASTAAARSRSAAPESSFEPAGLRDRLGIPDFRSRTGAGTGTRTGGNGSVTRYSGHNPRPDRCHRFGRSCFKVDDGSRAATRHRRSAAGLHRVSNRRRLQACLLPVLRVSVPSVSQTGSSQVMPPADLEGPGLAFQETKAAGDDPAHEEAKRLARLLVSEIKLYNGEQIRAGKVAGNIYGQMRDDIDRSRQMYEERIDARVKESSNYFRDELVRTLADGDDSILGM